MLHDLDNSITAMLTGHLPSDLAGTLSFSYGSPGAGFPPASLKLPAVNLYLHSATQNAALRQNAPTVQRSADGTVQKTRPAIFLDCVYLVSVWPDPEKDDNTAEEHRIFSEVLRAMLANPVLPHEDLQGSLQKTQSEPVRTKVEQVADQVWQALGGPSRLSLSYTVTVSMPVFDPEPAPLVTEKQIKFRTLEQEATP